MIVWTLTLTPDHAEIWMQQPFPSPEEQLPEEATPEGEIFEADPRPQLTPEQLAERSALEVFPGAEAEVEADQSWLRESDEPSGVEAAAPESLPEAFEDPAPPLSPAQLFPTTNWAEASPEQPIATPPPARAPSVVPDVPPAADIPTVPATPLDDDEFSRRALSMPLLGGRERREAAGASQRAAILAQAGTPLDLGDEDDQNEAPSEAAGRAPMPASGPRSEPSAAPAAPSSRRARTRKLGLSLFVSALALVVLSGAAIVFGQGAELERIASALTPDAIERWSSERGSSAGSSAVVTDARSEVVGTTPDRPDSLLGQIAHTGGVGVAVRTTCVPEARATRTIPEGTRVTVIARGVGDCSGWNVVRAGASVSWVEASHIEVAPLR